MTTRRTLLAGLSVVFAGGAVSRLALAQVAAGKLPPAPTVEQWAQSPQIENVALSPDGTQIAYIGENGDNKLLYHIDLKTKQNQAFNIGPTKVHSVFWVGNDHVAVTRSYALKRTAAMGLRANEGLATVYNMRDKSLVSLFKEKVGGKDSGLTTTPGSWGGLLEVARVGDTFSILANSYDYENDRDMLVRFGLDENRFDVIDAGGREVQQWIVGPDGHLVGRQEYYITKKTWALSYYDNGHWRQILTQTTDTDLPDVVGLSRDGKSLLVFLYTGADKGHYHDIDPTGKVSDPIPMPTEDAVPLFDHVTKRHNGFFTEENGGTYYYYDPKMQDLVAKAQKAVEGYRMSIAGHCDDPLNIIVYSEGDDDAGTYYLINFGTGTSLTIGSTYPDIAPECITSKQPFTYKAGDGLDIPAFLTLPPNREAKNLPLIVMPHGGPFSHDDISLDTETQTFASQGYAVLQPNFRGSDGYGSAFLTAGYGEWGGKMQSDLGDGVKALVAKGTVDPKRVCIVGTSYGGYAALAGATIDQGVYNCAVDISGVSDVAAWLGLQRDYLSEVDSVGYNYMKRYLGGVDPARISPVNLAAKASIPILIVHGKDDPRVPFKQSEVMVAALKAAGKDVTFLPLTNTDHNETNQAERIALMKAVVDFVQKHNPSKP